MKHIHVLVLIFLLCGVTAAVGQESCDRVIQNGTIINGAPVVWMAPCAISQAGGSNGSSIINGLSMITDFGVMGPVGILDAPITGPYHQALLNWQGNNFVLNLNSLGGAGAPYGYFSINNGPLIPLGPSQSPMQIGDFIATSIYAGDDPPPLSTFFNVLGSVSAPDTSLNAAGIFEKIGTGQVSGSQTNPALYVSNIKTGNTAGYRAQGIISEGYDPAGGNGTFVEGGRFHGTLSRTATSGAAYGVICLAQALQGVAWDFLVGCESDIENSTSDAPTTLNMNHFAVGYLATNAQGAGSKIADAGFAVNGYNAQPYRVGFLVMPTAFGGQSVSDAAFRSLGSTVYGLDLSGSTISFAAIEIPNNTPIRAKGVASADLNLVYVPSGSNSMIIGTDTQGVTFPAVSAPAPPGTGFVDVYVDGADSLLKTKSSAGQVSIAGVFFGTPASSSTTCTQGQMAFDATYIYTCIAANTWHRVSNGSTW